MKGFFKRFFKGISWVQILAGALAAGTVFLLSSKLGTAGTIIGAVVASACSTFASQLYQNILNESQKAIKNVAQEAKKSDGETDGSAGPVPAAGAGAAKPRVAGMTAQAGIAASSAVSSADVARLPRQTGTAADGTAVLSPSGTGAAGASVPAIDETSVMPPVTAGNTADAQETRTAPPAYQPGTGKQEDFSDVLAGKEPGVASHASSSPDDQARRKKRIAIIVSVAISLLIVAITAGIILLATNGKGTGNTLTTQTTTQTDDDKSTTTDTKPTKPDTGKPSTDSGTSTDSGSGSSTDSGTSSDSGSSSTDSGTGSGSSTDSGSSSSTDSGTGTGSGSTGTGSDSSTDSGTGSGTGSSDGSSDGSSSGSDSGSTSDSSKSKTGSSSGTGSASGTTTGSSTGK